MLFQQFKIHLLIITTAVALQATPAFTQSVRGPAPIKISAIHKVTNSDKHISHDGYEIPFFSIEAQKTKTPKHRFLLQSGLHGNERGAIILNSWLINRIRSGQGPLAKLNAQAAFDFIPIANPDGYRNMRRYNARAVNLNRNFSVLFGKSTENPGKSQFSERETKAIKSVLKKYKYTAAVDLHGYINWIVGPSHPGILGTAHNYSAQQLSQYSAWMKELQKNTRTLKGYELKTAGGLGDGGAFEDWAFWENQTFSFCLEVTREHNPQFHSVTKKNRFLEYESYLAKMFTYAIKLKGQSKTSTQQLASQNN